MVHSVTFDFFFETQGLSVWPLHVLPVSSLLIGSIGSSSPVTLSAVKAVVEMDGIILESIKQTMELVNNHE